MAAPLVLEQWRDVHRLLKAGKQPRLAACSAPKRKDKGNKAQKLSVPWEQANQWLSVFSNQPCHAPLLSSQNCGWETLLSWDHSSALPLGEEDGKEILTLVQSGSAANGLLFLLYLCGGQSLLDTCISVTMRTQFGVRGQQGDQEQGEEPRCLWNTVRKGRKWTVQ